MYCHESGVTGSWVPRPALPSPSPAYGFSSSPLLQPRSSSAPRRLTRSYCSGSDIPQTRPPAGPDPSPLFPFGYACTSFPLLSLLCCLRVLSPVVAVMLLARPVSSRRYVGWFPLVMLAYPFSVPYCLRVYSPVAADRVLAVQRPSAIMCFPSA